MSDVTLDQMANMSDDDFLSQAPSLMSTPESDSTDTDENNEGVTTDENAAQEDTQEATDAESEESTQNDVDVPEADEENVDNPDSDDSDNTDEESEEDDDNEDDQTTDDPEDIQKLRDDMEKLLSPFAANGTQIKVDSVEEAIDLMRMGANYHKKMHTIKPHMRLLKTLEKNKLLDEDKINFLIDVTSGNKQAISKLMRDASIDPLDLETKEDEDYSPVKHTVSEESVNLDEVLERVQDNPSFKDTMDIVTNQWDSSSKEILVANPTRIETLVAHKANGLFDRINAEVTKQRMLGKLPQSLSDVEAYEKVGMQMMQSEATVKDKPKSAQRKPKDSNAVSDRRKLASPKAKKPSTNRTPSSIDELAKLSDEDFLKSASKYL